MATTCRLEFLLLALGFIGAAAGQDSWSCDIAIHGLGPMSGLWMYKAGMYLPGDTRARYEQYTPTPARGINPSLEFDMAQGYYSSHGNGDAWLVLNYHVSAYGSVSEDAEILARCASATCVKATDVTKLPKGDHWEIAKKNCSCGPKACDASACGFQAVSTSVSIGCCDELPEVQRCDNVTWDDCAKLGPSLLHGNRCESTGCCSLQRHHGQLLPSCEKAYFPSGQRCKPFVALTGSTDVVVV